MSQEDLRLLILSKPSDNERSLGESAIDECYDYRLFKAVNLDNLVIDIAVNYGYTLTDKLCLYLGDAACSEQRLLELLC